MSSVFTKKYSEGYPRKRNYGGQEHVDTMEQLAIGRAGITMNKNSVPYDEASPSNPSGIKLGTPAVTSRSMEESEMQVITQCIAIVIKDNEDRARQALIKEDIRELVGAFLIYPGLTVLE